MMIWTLDRVLEVDLEYLNREKLELRIELFVCTTVGSVQKFKFRCFRYEPFNVEPAFEKNPEFKSAVNIWAVLDPSEETVPAKISSVNDAVNWYLDQLKTKMDVSL